MVVREWGALLAALAPAFDRLPFFDIAKMKADIRQGTAVVYEAKGDAKGVLVILAATEGDDLIAWIGAAAGSFAGGPKRRLAQMRDAIASTEEIARQAGFVELRTYGRNLRRILPDYEPLDGVNNGLRKVLRAPLEVVPISAKRIRSEWPTIADGLWSAIRQDPNCTLESVRKQLLNGSAVLFEVTHGGKGLWLVSLGDDGGKLVAWTTAIAGSIDGGPKRRLAVMRHALNSLELVLRNSGVTSHRICGRDYSRMFPGYRPLAGSPNGLEKVLA